MARTSFIAGLAVLIYEFAGGLVVHRLPVPPMLSGVLAAGLAFLVAGLLAGRVFDQDAAPADFGNVLLGAAALYFTLKLLGLFGLLPYRGGTGRVINLLTIVSLIASVLLTAGFLARRAALFVGVLAMAVQFEAGMFLAFLPRLPQWIPDAMTVFVAALIAWRLCISDPSPADRMRDPVAPWAFSGSGALSMVMTARPFMMSSWPETLVWLAFLASFILVALRLEPADPEPRRGIVNVPSISVFLALSIFIGMVFNVHEMVEGRIPRMATGLVVWLPFVVVLALAAVIMAVTNLTSRVPEHPPGHGQIAVGVIVLGIVSLGSNVMVSMLSAAGIQELLVPLLALAFIAVPIMAIGVALMGIGFLRLMFNLESARAG